jgi:hypothetical protein
LGAGLLTACAETPREQLRTYVTAFDAARDGSRVIYGALDDAVAEAKALQEPAAARDCTTGAPAPSCFDPADVLPKPDRPREPSIEARVVTFEAVALYNEALIALASGATGDALGARLTSLAGALDKAAGLAGFTGVGALTPLLAAPVINAFTALATRVETIRANAEARTALLKDEALTQDAIQALIDDTPAVYSLYLSAQGNVATAVPGAPLSAASVAAFQKIPAFHKALGQYVVLLNATDESHEALIAELRRPQSPEARLNTALDQALEIRSAGRALRDAVRPIAP